jgi:plastocyanin
VTAVIPAGFDARQNASRSTMEDNMRALLLAAALLLPPAAAHAGDMMEAEIKVFQFMPKEITVKTGTVIKWTNSDSIDHSVTDKGGSFDTDFFNKGESREITAGKPGTYEIFCKRHNSMKATLVVTE